MNTYRVFNKISGLSLGDWPGSREDIAVCAMLKAEGKVECTGADHVGWRKSTYVGLQLQSMIPVYNVWQLTLGGAA